MKTKIKFLTSLPLLSLSLLISNIYIVGAEGLGGVTVDGGKIAIDIGEAGKNGGATDLPGFWNKVFDIGKVTIAGVTGILAIVMVGVFTYKSFKLSTSGGNPKAKQDAIDGMLYAFIGTSLLGSASLIAGLAFGLFG